MRLAASAAVLTVLVTMAFAGAAGAAEKLGPSKVADVDLWGSVSPTGTKLAFVDWSTGNLVLRDLESGGDAELTDKGTWMESGEFGMYPIFSPDGRWITYTWFNAEGFWDLRQLELDGGEPRVLFADPERPYIQPHAVSPDGSSILVTVESGPLDKRLAMVSIAGGEMRTLAELGWRVPSTACFVGAGKAVVYDRLPTEEATTRALLLQPVDGGEAAFLLDPGSAEHLLLGCSPGGREVFFASDRAGSWDLWRLEIGAGGVAGDLEAVLAEVGPIVRGLGVTRDGAFYYGLQQGSAHVYLGPVEPGEDGGRALERLAGPVLFNSEAAWSPDGERLAYVRQRGAARSGLVYSFDFTVREMASGQETRQPLAMTSFGGHAFALDWSGDGRFVLAQGRDRAGREGYYRIDAADGSVHPVVQSTGCPPACLEWPTLAADGTLYFTRWTESGQRIVARDPASGEERVVMPVEAPQAVGPLGISPDGEWLAALWKDMASRTLTLRAMAPKRRTGRDLGAIEPPLWVTALDWTPDSQHLLYSTTDPQGAAHLWRLPLDFGEPEDLGRLAAGLQVYGLAIHPDGGRMAVTAGTPRRSEVWAVFAAGASSPEG